MSVKQRDHEFRNTARVAHTARVASWALYHISIPLGEPSSYAPLSEKSEPRRVEVTLCISRLPA